MKKLNLILIIISFSLLSFSQKKVRDIELPEGYKRTVLQVNSFGYYLRDLTLKDNDTLYYYHGAIVETQEQFAILNIDIGNKDLLQCADATIKLRAEYLYKQRRYDEIHFNYLFDGKPRYFKDEKNLNYKSFQKYLDKVYNYANTASLDKELKSRNINNMEIGDILIQPSAHAVIIIDIATNIYGEKIFLLAQGYMPAQSIHILSNPFDKDLSPYYKCGNNDTIPTLDWEFYKNNLKKWE